MNKVISEIKVLRKRISEKLAQKKAQLAKVKEEQRALAVIESDLEKLQEREKDLSVERPIGVIDHAVLRYIERIDGVDVKAAKSKVLPEDHPIREAIKTLGGSGTFPIGTSHSIVMKNWKVVTVIPQ